MTGAFTEIIFTSVTPQQTELLIAALSEKGIEGFEERECMLLAYVAASQFDLDWLNETAHRYEVSYTINEIEATNWNAQWESNFDPVTIGTFLHIRAAFHDPGPPTNFEIVITPKMSFGTGHHATTRLMVTAMNKLSLTQKSVLDFGTGTGILAIMAEKLGAALVVAIDNDLWSIDNAAENIKTNHCQCIELSEGDRPPAQKGRFEVVLANINTFLIKQHLPALVGVLQPGGQLLLSGILEQDIAELVPLCEQQALRLQTVETLSGWAMLQLAY